MVTGGVKAGKSTFAFYLARRNYKRILFHWFIRSKIFFWKKIEKPLFYSNIPVKFDYVPVTSDLLLRKKRFAFGSVIWIDESSLIADSQMFRDMDLNERLTFFNKLIGHETHGGLLVYDTQALSDNHYSCKRCVSENYYVHHIIKKIPFFILAYVLETRYSDDGSIVTVSATDVEESLKKVIIPKRCWKLFDCYAFSSFTDDLPVENKVIHGDLLPDLKVRDFASFKTYVSLTLPKITKKENTKCEKKH